MSNWDHSSYNEFYDYYADASQSAEAVRRFSSIRDKVLRILENQGCEKRPLEVADIGCGAGTQSIVWAESGHRVYGLDINKPLLELATERANKAGYDIDFRIGSAVKLPWPDQTMDVCLLLELLEHVPDWKSCLTESVRILRPGGVLFLTTTNKLCPIQQEFNLPLYSWYPAPLKRHFVNLSVTTYPKLANFAKYPAVNWFSFYSLRRFLNLHEFQCRDRFDLIDLTGKSSTVRTIIFFVKTLPLLRWLAHVATQGTTVVAIRKNGVRE